MANPICQACWDKHYRAKPEGSVNAIALSLAVAQRFLDDTCRIREHLGLAPPTDGEMSAAFEEHGCVLCKLPAEAIGDIVAQAMLAAPVKGRA